MAELVVDLALKCGAVIILSFGEDFLQGARPASMEGFWSPLELLSFRAVL